MAKKRSNVRQHILSSIINYIEKNNGRSPTYREIGDDVKIHPWAILPTISNLLKRMGTFNVPTIKVVVLQY